MNEYPLGTHFIETNLQGFYRLEPIEKVLRECQFSGEALIGAIALPDASEQEILL